jgi:predicted kinase
MKSRRDMWVRMAKEFDLVLDIYWKQTDLQTCLDRNEEIGRLDKSIIERMANQFQEPIEQEGCIIKI